MIHLFINSLLSLKSLVNSRQNKDDIDQIKRKLSFINDDLNWLSSNNSGKLVKEITNLKIKYETELEEINEKIISNKLLEQDLSSFVGSLQTNSPEVLDFVVNNNLKIYDLISLSMTNIKGLYNISEELAIKIEEAISSIGMVAIKYGISIEDLTLKIDSNEKYILALSQKVMDIQIQLNTRFQGIKEDLIYVQEEVNRQLLDIGLVSSNTTAVLLSDGSLKISDNLTRYTDQIFVGKANTLLNKGSSQGFGGSGQPITNPAAVSFTGSLGGPVNWTHSFSSYSNTTKIKNIVPIEEDKGILLDFSSSKDIIIQNVNLHQPIFVVLKGGGLANIDLGEVIPMFRPAIINRATLSLNKWTETRRYYVQTVRSAFSLVETTVGTAGSFIIPVANEVTNYKQFLSVTVQSKSDSLIIFKINKVSGWTTILGSAVEKGGFINGKAPGTLNDFITPNEHYASAGISSSGVFLPTPPESIIDKGDLILRFPASHLTFHGVEVIS